MQAYEAALSRLFARTQGVWRLGLERVEALLALVGHPDRRFPIFHVAGTNGKGSTVATLDAVLRHAGRRVGRYTSPHLVDFQERIVVNGVPIPRDRVVAWLDRWDSAIDRMGATFFEATTALALSWFAEQVVDVAVVEVGLGGRLDATNVVHPVAAAVTQIGFDHVEYLGTTLEAIAGEKAGIFKAGVPAVIGDQDPAMRAVLEHHAARRGASPVLVAGRDWQVRDPMVTESGTSFTLTVGAESRQVTTPLIGAFQAHNTATAFAMLRAAGEPWAAIERTASDALGAVHLAGRFHRAGRYLFDVAHNADGAATVAATVQGLGLPRPIVAVVCVLRDKDWQGILRSIGALADELVVTQAPTAPASRAWDPALVASWAVGAGIRATLMPGFDDALAHAERTGGTILVTGSFHTVGDAMARLQVDPLAR